MINLWDGVPKKASHGSENSFHSVSDKVFNDMDSDLKFKGKSANGSPFHEVKGSKGDQQFSSLHHYMVSCTVISARRKISLDLYQFNLSKISY